MEHAVTIQGLGGAVTLEPIGDQCTVLSAMLREAWSRCLTDEPAAKRITVALTPDAPPLERQSAGQLSIAGPELDPLMGTITQRITLALIEQQAGQLLMLHAAGLASSSGASAVLVAPSLVGKTTLVSRLGKQFGYLTDETVAIRADHTVAPYPKPLSLRSERGRREVSPDELSLRVPDPNPHVGRILWLNRLEDGPRIPAIRELDLFDALVALVPQSSALSAMPSGLTRLAELIEATGPVLELTYCEAEDLSPALTDILEGTS